MRVLGGILSGQRSRVTLGAGCSALCLSFLRCEAGACVLGFLPLVTQDGKNQASHPRKPGQVAEAAAPPYSLLISQSSIL